MGLLTYSGISLPYSNSTDFHQESVYDESNTDRIYTRFDISVQSLVNFEYMQMLAPELLGATNNPANIMKAVRAKLLRPRRLLSYKFNGVELIPAKQALTAGGTETVPGTVDAKNGPQPQFCNILQATNTTYLISFRVIAHYWENLVVDTSRDPITRNNTGQNVLYNRWSEMVDMDDCMTSTRTREGKFVIRSDNAGNIVVDQLRSQMAVLGHQPGFIRDSAYYASSPDGLSLTYKIVDKEVFKMPPQLKDSSDSSPTAFRASGKYRETAVKYANVRHGEFMVRLRGANNISQGNLLNTALAMAIAKTGNRQRQLIGTRGGLIPESVVVEQNLFENEVDVLYRVRYKNPENRAKVHGIAGFQDMDMSTPFSSLGVSPAYTDRGSVPLLVQAARYYDPSVLGVQLGKGDHPFSDENPLTPPIYDKYQLNDGIEVGRAGVQVEE